MGKANKDKHYLYGRFFLKQARKITFINTLENLFCLEGFNKVILE